MCICTVGGRHAEVGAQKGVWQGLEVCPLVALARERALQLPAAMAEAGMGV